MDERYEAYCLADPVFYDSPLRAGSPEFEIAARPLPHGWMSSEQEDTLALTPKHARLPPQGWKIHASACLDDAEAVLAAVWEHCVARGVPFKFVRSPTLLLLRNSKYADRASSGKLATIYPADEAQLERILGELGAELEGSEGPYILSDLRYGAGPLYVRYGGFAARFSVREGGRLAPVIEDGDGRLVPDARGPTFAPPPWAALPAFLEPHLAARNAATVEELPYRIERALHFSNAGGLYLGEDRATGERVVLKEARPHAGLSADGADAVARLRREREMLERLAGLDAIPAARDHFTLEDHHFLVREFVEGSPLSALLTERFPLTGASLSEADAADFAQWALASYERIESALAAVHERGVVLGDLHPSNVLVRPDGGVVLIDLEIATLADEERPPTLAAPGFAAPLDVSGYEVDLYALACLKLSLFLPLTELCALDPGKPKQIAEAIGELFPAACRPAGDAARVIGGSAAPPPGFEPDGGGWRAARDSMARAILASASPERDDRLFPGDVRGFAPGGGLNLGHGAAGVLYALASAGIEPPAEHVEWLIERSLRFAGEIPLGFYDGLHGVAHALERLDRRPEALRLLDLCIDRVAGAETRLGLDLYGGISGIGLNLAHFAGVTGDPSLLESARRMAELVADRMGDHPSAGLMRGASGAALMFLRLYEQTGDAALLDLAEGALRRDLRRCVQTGAGGLQVDEGWRTMPYLAEGSAGIGMVLDDFLVHRDDDLSDAAGDIRRAAQSIFYIEPGLFRGRAGMLAYLSRGAAHEAGGSAEAHIRRLSWHAVPYAGGIAFPGEQLLRLSMDLASGTAGVLLALATALHDPPAHLPFLQRAGAARPATGKGVILAADSG